LRNTFAVFGAIALVILAAVMYRIRKRAIEIIGALKEK
jgi:hypothetical protein